MSDSNRSHTERIQKNLYGVTRGKQPVIYTDLGLCHRQTNRVAGALNDGFEEFDDCVRFMCEANICRCLVHQVADLSRNTLST